MNIAAVNGPSNHVSSEAQGQQLWAPLRPAAHLSSSQTCWQPSKTVVINAALNQALRFHRRSTPGKTPPSKQAVRTPQLLSLAPHNHIQERWYFEDRLFRFCFRKVPTY
ncbi:hypothetical protein M3J09_010967 [Ascochyta lentis]